MLTHFVKKPARLASFEGLFLPHMDAAYNLARWLIRNDRDWEDLVQEAYLRAWKAFDGFRGKDARPWLLRIVRNTCYTWMRENRSDEWTTFNEEMHSTPNAASNPETMLTRSVDGKLLQDALQGLPPHLREVMVLREFEALSYREIATVSGVPLGTVMSRLARARLRLQRTLAISMERPIASMEQHG
jgi:RNA polymerase sigma-70 factor (ECF subfamily)